VILVACPTLATLGQERAVGVDVRRWSGFDLLRIVAACVVVVSHAIYLTGTPEPQPLAWSADPWPLGTWGVAVFFVTSGFLVTRSWELDPDLGRFASRRATRIWPALVVVVVGMALVAGPVLTALPVRDYLSDPTTWTYIALNAVLATVYFLPGVFLDHVDAVVNGSLWSLPLEVACYVVVAALGVVGVMRRRGIVIALAVTAVVLAWLVDVGVVPLAEQFGTLAHRAPALLALFLLGAAAQKLPLPRSPWLVAAAVAFVVLAHDLPVSGIGYVALTYLVLWVGTASSTAIDRLHRLGDPSYGIFLWGWPVSQLLIVLGVHTPVALVLLSVLVSIAFGYASWWAIERRALHRTRARLAAVSARSTAPIVVGEQSPSH
jgi:peptidoglycan/LPS O-acetylase OafA/YrhL